eukprot:COSAG02_NODE_959_length_15647_cov_74.362748_8_plen_160_part_00
MPLISDAATGRLRSRRPRARALARTPGIHCLRILARSSISVSACTIIASRYNLSSLISRIAPRQSCISVSAQVRKVPGPVVRYSCTMAVLQSFSCAISTYCLVGYAILRSRWLAKPTKFPGAKLDSTDVGCPAGSLPRRRAPLMRFLMRNGQPPQPCTG